jgi:RNA polymerase sigma factor (sigma-70 family)
MSESTITSRLQVQLDRLRAGQDTARGDLISLAYERLTILAHRIFREGFPKLRTAIETGDVVNATYLRLMRALADVCPETPRDFFRLAALQIRRVLLDLVREREGRDGTRPTPVNNLGEASRTPVEPAETTLDPARLALWEEFHEAVEKLPAEEREAFELVWYHGLSQDEAAEILGVDKSTVKRRCRRAREKLANVIPDGAD